MTPRNVLRDGFLPEDFQFSEGQNQIFKQFSIDVADIANALLEQALKDAVRVYCIEEDVADGRVIWNASEICDNRDTHTGLLINVEKIGAKDGE